MAPPNTGGPKSISALRPCGPRLVQLMLDDGSSLVVGRRFAEQEGLAPGAELSSARVNELAHKEVLHRGMEVGLRYLELRPRSEAEIRLRLGRARFDAETVDAVLGKLRDTGLVDDAAFARTWSESRSATRGTRLVRHELRRKGVPAAETADALAGVDDNAHAREAARKKARTLGACAYPAFRDKVGAYLLRRGFSYETARRTVERLWQEQKQLPTRPGQDPDGESMTDGPGTP